MLTQCSFIRVFTNDPQIIQAVLEIEGVLTCGGLVHSATSAPIHCLATISPGRDVFLVLEDLHRIPVEALVVLDGRRLYQIEDNL